MYLDECLAMNQSILPSSRVRYRNALAKARKGVGGQAKRNFQTSQITDVVFIYGERTAGCSKGIFITIRSRGSLFFVLKYLLLIH